MLILGMNKYISYNHIRKCIKRLKEGIMRYYLILRVKLGDGTVFDVGGSSALIYFSSDEELSTVEYIRKEESEIISRVLSKIEKDDIVWDVGANIGVHSCLFAEKAEKVVAFEPYKPNVNSLRKNKLMNNLDIEICRIGLSDNNGREEISIPEKESPGNQWPALLPNDMSESRKESLENSEKKEIKVKKGDTIIGEKISLPNVVKVDVEGASMNVLKGMEKILGKDSCRLVYVEVHLPMSNQSRPSIKDFGHEIGEIKELLNRKGFETKNVVERDNDFFLRGEK